MLKRIGMLLFLTTLALSLLLFTGSIAGAQTARARIADTPIRGEAHLSSPIIATLKEGGLVDIVDLQGDWYRVLVPNEQGKPRVGYVLAHLIEIVNTARPTAGPPIPPTRAQLDALQAERKALQQVDALRADLNALQNAPSAQAVATSDQSINRGAIEPQNLRRPILVPATPSDHGWINTDLVRVQSAHNAQTFTFAAPLYNETVAAAAAYSALPGATDIGISGGITIRHGLGIAVNFEAVNYQSTVGLGVIVPSPYFYNTLATAGTTTATSLARQDRSLDISAVYTVPIRDDRLRVRIFGGPTYFHLTNNMVETIGYNQVANVLVPLNFVAVTSFTQKEVSGSALGFNVGADVSWFFTRHVGVGGGLRFNRGIVTLLEPLSGHNADLTVGGPEFGGGLRLRF
jgi:hypothetical protein